MSKSSDQPSGRRRAAGRPTGSDSERSHEALLDAARAHFASRGYDRASVREIAQQGGYTTSTLYHYFTNKLGLYVSVYRDAERRVAACYQEALDRGGSRPERVQAMLAAAVALHAEDETVPVFLAAVPLEIRRHPELLEAIRQVGIDTARIVGEIVADADGNVDGALVTLLSSLTIGIALTVGPNGESAYAKALRAASRHLDLRET